MTSSTRHTFAFDDSSGDFSVNSQRPPVPGEENDDSQNASIVCDKALLFLSKTSGELTHSSTSGIPRRLTNEASAKGYYDAQGIGAKFDRCDSGEAPLGFEPEGSSALSTNFQENSNSSGTPSCLKWAENFNYLLQDSDGVNLFKKFLDDREENCDLVDFWFACTGLKIFSPTEKDHITGLAKLIYKKYIKGNSLRLKPDIKQRIGERLLKDPVEQAIFNEAQVEVENVMRNDLYPLFLKSDIYLQFLHSGGDSPKPTSHDSSSSEVLFSGSGVGKLPTLQEEEELTSDALNDDEFVGQLQFFSQGMPRIRDGLPMDRYAGISNPYIRSRNSNSCHISFAPVSAQDSELQSISSEAPTDDTLSFTDSSVDGSREYVVQRNKMALRKQEKVMRQNADANQMAGLHQHFIPRTQIVKPDCNMSEKDPQKFASLLTERLVKVKEERDRQECIQETDEEGNVATSQHRSGLPKSTAFNSSLGPFSITSMLFASAMTSSDHEDNAQSILDDHVSHIWNSSGVTPSRSPGRLTPDHQRREAGGHIHVLSSKLRSKEAAADSPGLFAAFGKDSKFVHSSSSKSQQHSGKEFRSFASRDVELGNQSRRHQIVSTTGVSVPVQSWNVLPFHPSSRPGADDLRYSAVRQAMQNAAADDLVTGFSKMETCAAERYILPSSGTTKERVMMWILENEKYCDARAHCSTDCSEKGSSNKRSNKSAGKKGSSHKQNRSESLDRGKLCSLPTSDFVPCPQGAGNQLSTTETKRLSADDSKVSFNKSNGLGRQKTLGEACDAKRNEGTVIGYYFCDEPIPYRTTIPSRNVTLGHLKQLIAKKGNYRYYCKKACNDFESGVVHEEITNDNDVLPLWEGKVFCKIERLA